MNEFNPSHAVAVLTVTHPNGTTNTDVFTDADEWADVDPFHRAEALKSACEDDFPDSIFAIGMNEKARALMTVANMRGMGFEDYTIQDAQQL